MKIVPTKLDGAFIIEPEMLADERGFFARTYCREDFQQAGLADTSLQCSISFNNKKGTLRGLHFQYAPYEETKLIRCTMGTIFDVIVDLRPSSPTFKSWIGVKLSAANRIALYVPGGFAHGFQTQEDNCEVYYQMSTGYVPAAAAGVRYNDSELAISWPLPVTVISARDLALPFVTDLKTQAGSPAK